MFTYLISKQQIYPRYLLCHIYCVRANERYHNQHHINKWLCFLLTEKYRGICMYSLHSFCDFLSFSATLLLSLSYQRPHHPTVAVQLQLPYPVRRVHTKMRQILGEKRSCLHRTISLFQGEKSLKSMTGFTFCFIWSELGNMPMPVLIPGTVGQDHHD